jgi:DNA-binding response OmpR family regulator
MSSKKSYRILIVDDEVDITRIIKQGLEREDFEVEAFNDPEEALANFKAGSYDLLLLDIRMPKMNGFQLYKKLREIDDKTKICFITAFEIYYDEFRRVFPKVRVNCFVRKPVRLEELAKTIMEELEGVQVQFDRSQQ